MRLSNSLAKTRKDAPADEVSKNAQLLIRAGYINKELAGVYSYLPLGYKVLQNIIQIIREEMNGLGGQELFLTALQNKEPWEKSGRWDDDVVDVWFKTKLHNGTELGLANTHEEALTNLMSQHINSYIDLPKYAYQFQTKFRNELRAKSGIMRTREFIMKDLYSFCATQDEQEAFYEEAKQAYIKIFNRIGIGDVTYLTFASGGSFAKFSHEFQTVCDAGEDDIYIDEDKNIALNEEVLNDEVLADLGLDKDKLIKKRAAEVGNIFNLGTKFSSALGLQFTDDSGESQDVWMGSYGIGPGRVMGVIVETFADDKGLVWPENIAPAKYHIIPLGNSDEANEEAENLYQRLTNDGVEVVFDDRKMGAGQKMAEADLLGIPNRVVVSPKTLEQGKVELKKRTSEEVELVDASELN